MPQPLNFLIALFDKMSGPATAASTAMDALSHSIEKAHKHVGGFESKWTKLNSALELGKKGFEVVRGVAEGALGILERVGEQQATQGIFEDVLGKSEGRALLDWLAKIQRSTGFAKDALEGLTQPLLEQFKGGELRRVLVAGLDIGRGDLGRTREALDALMKVQSAGGKMKIGGFRALGLQAPEGFKAAKGVGGEAEVAITLEKLLAMVAEKSGGQLGSRAILSSTTVAAQLAHLRGAPAALWDKLADSPALPKITDAIGKLTDALTSDKLVNGLASLVEKMATGLPEFLDKLGTFVRDTDWTAVAAGLVKVIEALAKIAGFGGKVVGPLVGGQEEMLSRRREQSGALERAGHGVIYRFLLGDTGIGGEETAKQLAYEAGHGVGSSYADGIRASESRATGAAESIALASIGGIREKLGAHSPSRVMMQLGGYAGEGFALGLEGKQGRIDGALSAAVAIDDVAARSRYNGRGPVTVTFGDIIINGAGKDTATIGDELEQRIRNGVRDALEEYGLEAGLA